jgi:predicted nucleic acid-binding protein
MLRKIKIYLETTMFNYYMDKNRDANPPTVAIFEAIGRGDFEGYTSIHTTDELNGAKEPKKSDMLKLIENYHIQSVGNETEARRLADLYIAQKIISVNKRYDALHIASASVNGLDVIATMNFKHIHRERTRRLVEIVNLEQGYKAVLILSPMEVYNDYMERSTSG